MQTDKGWKGGKSWGKGDRGGAFALTRVQERVQELVEELVQELVQRPVQGPFNARLSGVVPSHSGVRSASARERKNSDSLNSRSINIDLNRESVSHMINVHPRSLRRRAVIFTLTTV